MRLPREVNRRVGRAMHDYGMLADGDRVLIAVSGGIDSLVLTRLLAVWRQKAPIRYEMSAVHIDMGMDSADAPPAAVQIGAMVAACGVSLRIVPAVWKPDPQEAHADEAGRDLCFRCARSRRTQLFAHAREIGYNKIALGHHRDDIIETFLLNLTCAGNISTMSPCQELFSGRLTLIRPLAYLDKGDVEALGRAWHLQPVRSGCPLAEKTKRRDIQQLAEQIYRQIPGAKEHIFAALGNVRSHYLLKQAGGRRP